MANAEHVAKLKAGVEAWNDWRFEDCPVDIDLSRADLSGMDIYGANLGEANLSAVDLRRARLYETVSAM
jgi:uncharacterized protein YjbI with pentapeptide repeats